jgi:hypothetical protein
VPITGVGAPVRLPYRTYRTHEQRELSEHQYVDGHLKHRT